MNNCLSSPIEILLIEDSLSDVKLISRAFQELEVAYRLRVVPDGVTAIACLQQENGYSNYPQPDLILLDLNLPQKDGLTVLQEIKSNLRLAKIPVIMLSASEDPQDITECYRQEANCYVSKPKNLSEFRRTIQELQSFWLQMVKLPTR